MTRDTVAMDRPVSAATARTVTRADSVTPPCFMLAQHTGHLCRYPRRARLAGRLRAEAREHLPSPTLEKLVDTDGLVLPRADALVGVEPTGQPWRRGRRVQFGDQVQR